MSRPNYFILLIASLLVSGSQGASGQELVQPPRATVPDAAGKALTEPPAIPAYPAEAGILDAATGEPQLFDLEELLQLASRNNPTLRQARLHVSAELAKALQAGLYPNPVVSYEAEQVGLDVPGNKDSPGEFQGGAISQRFVTAGKLRLSREKYLRRAHVSEHLVMVQRFRVCNDVRLTSITRLLQASDGASGKNCRRPPRMRL